MHPTHKIIDLTHTLSSDIPSWDGGCIFNMKIDTDYEDCLPPDKFRIQKIECNNGSGTHVDAPAHIIPNGRTVDNLTFEELVAPLIVIDVNNEANESYVITTEIIEKFEKEYGKIEPNSFVIFYTGWEKYWSDRKKYHNDHKFPSIDESVAKLLIERNIVGIGVDTLSADTGKNGFPVHRMILGADKYLVENVASAGGLPTTGAEVYILPLKIKDGTEAPIRMLALL